MVTIDISPFDIKGLNGDFSLDDTLRDIQETTLLNSYLFEMLFKTFQEASPKLILPFIINLEENVDRQSWWSNFGSQKGKFDELIANFKLEMPDTDKVMYKLHIEDNEVGIKK
jgi:hypothetical protein